jgi:hypothetical protein
MLKTMSEKNWFFFQFHSRLEAGQKKNFENRSVIVSGEKKMKRKMVSDFDGSQFYDIVGPYFQLNIQESSKSYNILCFIFFCLILTRFEFQKKKISVSLWTRSRAKKNFEIRSVIVSGEKKMKHKMLSDFYGSRFYSITGPYYQLNVEELSKSYKILRFIFFSPDTITLRF